MKIKCYLGFHDTNCWSCGHLVNTSRCSRCNKIVVTVIDNSKWYRWHIKDNYLFKSYRTGAN